MQIHDSFTGGHLQMLILHNFCDKGFHDLETIVFKKPFFESLEFGLVWEEYTAVENTFSEK